METDIQKIINRLSVKHPNIKVEQLQIKFAADDGGLWFFTIVSDITPCHGGVQVNLESSTYNFPFMCESTKNTQRITVYAVEEAILAICNGLGIS